MVTSQRDQSLPKAAWFHEKVHAISVLWIAQLPILQLAKAPQVHLDVAVPY